MWCNVFSIFHVLLKKHIFWCNPRCNAAPLFPSRFDIESEYLKRQASAASRHCKWDWSNNEFTRLRKREYRCPDRWLIWNVIERKNCGFCIIFTNLQFLAHDSVDDLIYRRTSYVEKLEIFSWKSFKKIS